MDRRFSCRNRDCGRALRACIAVCSLLSVFGGVARAQQGAIPTPESVLGFTVGADFKLATYDESMRYFQRLAASSDHIKLMDVGKTSHGACGRLAGVHQLDVIARRLGAEVASS